jgi:hypothetical protein
MLAANDRHTTALLLAHIAEADERRLYAPAGYSSMYAYCMGELLFSDDAARRHVYAGRTAQRFPVIFEMVEDGRLHLTAVLLLAPFLTHENASELLEAASRKSKAKIELMLVRRFPKPDVPALMEPLPTRVELPLPASPLLLEASPVSPSCLDTTSTPDHDSAAAPALPATPPPPASQNHSTERALERVPQSVFVKPAGPPPRVAPLSPGRFSIKFTMGQEMHDKLRHAQALLRHQVPSGELAEIFDRALDALIERLEKRKFAATSNPRPRRNHASANPRYIPAAVKQEVWERDGGQCTFVSDSGRRCEERDFLEFDHMDPVALGGQTSAERIRLRCRAHNQLEAERVFGTAFMARKREKARQRKSAHGAA